MGCGSSMETPPSASEQVPNAALRIEQNGGSNVTVNGETFGSQLRIYYIYMYFCVQNIVRQYVRLDEQISKVEGSCPGPRMATAEAWIEHLQAKRDAMLGLGGIEHPAAPQTALGDEARADAAATLPLALRNGRAGNDMVANTPTNDLAQVRVVHN